MVRIFLVHWAGVAMSLVLMLATAVAVQGSVSPAAAAPGGGKPRLVVSAPTRVPQGEAVELRLSLRGAPADFAGYETQLRFDTDRAQYAGVLSSGTGVADVGRGLIALGGAEHEDGVSFGFVSCTSSNCVQPAKGRRSGKKAPGSVELGTVRVLPSVAGHLQLAFGTTKMATASGESLAVAAPKAFSVQVGDSDRVLPAPASRLPKVHPARAPKVQDLTGDRQVTYADIMEVNLAWRLARETGATCATGANGAEDVDSDGCIDVADVQRVAAAADLAPTVESSAREGSTSLSATADASTAESTLLVVGSTLVVNSTGDAADASGTDGSCRTAAGDCTLRAAIEEANAQSGANAIHFAIPGTGVKTIALKSRLPTIADASGPTTIDGYTQAGATPNTTDPQSNAAIKVEVRGGGEDLYDAFSITSSNNVLRGLAIYGSKWEVRILGLGAVGNTLEGNFIGTNAAGSYFSSTRISLSGGVTITEGATRTMIGGTTLAQRNVVSGNAYIGILLYDEPTDHTVIRNNIIGLSPSGGKLGNKNHGVDINGNSSDALVADNVISNNGRGGVELSHGRGVTRNEVVRNYIGTLLDGDTVTSYSGNLMFGIRMEDKVTANVVADNVVGANKVAGIKVDNSYENRFVRNRIGIGVDGTALSNEKTGIMITNHANNTMVGPDNIIAHNPVGITVSGNVDNDYNTITQNSIFSNVGLGIDLAPVAAVNLNDPGDGDSGANDQLNYPKMTAATTTAVTGTVCGGCTVEIFKADAGNDAWGEGKTLVGTAEAAPDGTFAVAVTGQVSNGDVVTSTATDDLGNTSEFSNNITVGGEPTPEPQLAAAADTYGRVVTDGWGSADIGGAYKLYGPASQFDVAGGVGTVEVPLNGGYGAYLQELSTQDVDMVFDVATDKEASGYRQTVIVAVRSVARSTEYRGKVQLASGGVYVRAEKILGGATTALSSLVKVSGLTHQANTPLRIRMQAVGEGSTTVKLKVWPTSIGEPASWQYSATDSEAQLQAPGAVGVRAQMPGVADNAPVTYSFDNLSVTTAP